MKPCYRVLVGLLALAFALFAGTTEAGHESPFYPSFYPQEIKIERLDAGLAATELQNNSLHAYVGGDPFARGAAPGNVSAVASFGSYLVVTFDRSLPALKDRDRRCASAREVVGALAGASDGYVFHPYPVTPYHEDYLDHYDLVESSRAPYRGRGEPKPSLRLRVRGEGPLARKLVSARWPLAEKEADATVEEIDLQRLLASRRISLDGWVGPPWVKEGWFHAYLLFADAVTEDKEKRAVEALYRRLVTGGYGSVSERINLERELVGALLGGCERVVIGYTVRREYTNSDYSAGVENVGRDSQTGLNSAIFVRTVKLKDFPWNGWLRVGIATRASAAWNPVAGFTDATGGLVWSALGDPAFLPAPQGGGWIPNRVTTTVAPPSSVGAGVEIPEDALRPEAGTGRLTPVGRGVRAKAKIVYRAVMSAFHDGTRMTVADVVYPYLFASRWGAGGASPAPERDPDIERSTALLRSWLAAFRLVKVDTLVREFGEDLKFTYDVPVVEVYLDHHVSDAATAALVAPPWSTLPWPVMVLMEEAVRRGYAAFSQPEAVRRGVAWLDLVRDQRVKARLAALVDEFVRQRYVPDALKRFVTADEAGRRWEALRQFYAAHGHFLVTNGPYRLDKWSPDSVVLTVFRDLTYPLGVGTFDRYAIPLRAYIARAEQRGGRVEIDADVERISHFQRTYEIVREALHGKAAEIDELPECRYVVVGADGAVVDAGTARFRDTGPLAIDLKAKLKPGRYTILAALYLGGNTVNPEVKLIPYRVSDGS